MKKIFILLAASMLCFVSEASSANLVADRVLIGDLYYNLYDNGTAEVKYKFSYTSDLSGAVIIPSSVQVESATYVVTGIGDWAFLNCKSITSVTIPNSIITIGAAAFDGCEITEPVYNAHMFVYLPRSYSGHYSIPQGIEQIVKKAFWNCKSLTSVTIPNSVTSIGYSAFEDCKSLTSVTIPKHAQVGGNAFYGCSPNLQITYEE